jgi:hypothetical protein
MITLGSLWASTILVAIPDYPGPSVASVMMKSSRAVAVLPSGRVTMRLIVPLQFTV